MTAIPQNRRRATGRPPLDVDTARELARGKSKDRQFVTALARGLEILRAFVPNDGPLGNQEIAQRTRLPKPTVSRLTHTLTRLGYLNYLERLEKYQLGTAVLSLGYAVLANLGIRSIARPFMQELADYAQASVSLGSRDRLNMVYIEHCRPETPITLRLDLGSRIPLATTAMGRALLAALPDDERGYLMEHIAQADAKLWPRVRAGIEQAIDDYRTRGFTLSVGDWQQDVHAVGVALKPADGSPILALNCGGPAFLYDRRRLINDFGPRLVNLARNVEATIGRQ